MKYEWKEEAKKAPEETRKEGRLRELRNEKRVKRR
jgi:hypothetical protein